MKPLLLRTRSITTCVCSLLTTILLVCLIYSWLICWYCYTLQTNQTINIYVRPVCYAKKAQNKIHQCTKILECQVDPDGIQHCINLPQTTRISSLDWLQSASNDWRFVSAMFVFNELLTFFISISMTSSFVTGYLHPCWYLVWLVWSIAMLTQLIFETSAIGSIEKAIGETQTITNTLNLLQKKTNAEVLNHGFSSGYKLALAFMCINCIRSALVICIMCVKCLGFTMTVKETIHEEAPVESGVGTATKRRRESKFELCLTIDGPLVCEG